jgi:single-strand DNA-binding protein
MANLNKVMLIGRLTRDPEPIKKPNSNEILGAKIGFAVNNRKFNQQEQKWEDEPVFIDCEIWNRGENTQGNRLLDTVKKGQQLFIEGRLRFDQWDDNTSKTGKRSALRVVIENFQYLEPRADGGEGGGQRTYQQSRPAGQGQFRQAAHSAPPDEDFDGPPMGAPAAGGRGGAAPDPDDIPF